MKRARLILILFAAAVLSLSALLIFRDREPRYQGRTLTEWIDSITQDYIGPRSHYQAREESASRALQQLAPEAIPILLKWVQAKDGSLRLNLAAAADSLPFLHLHVSLAEQLNYNAIVGFRLLGTNAKPAWPKLIELSHASNTAHRIVAAQCFFQSGPPKEILEPLLLGMLQDPDKDVREHAASMLHARYSQDAQSAGVYKMFPEIKDLPTEGSITNLLRHK